MMDVIRKFKNIFRRAPQEEIDQEDKKERLVGKHNLLLLSLQKQDEEEETSEWIGFVQTMKIFIKRSFAYTNNRVDVQIDEVKSEMKDMKQTLKTILTRLEKGNIGN